MHSNSGVRWPPPGSDELDSWGIDAFRSLCSHFAPLPCMQGFDMSEALFQYSRLKKELIGEPFFGKSYRAFWEHVSNHYSGIHGYPIALIPIRVSLLILADTSCNERGFSEYNRIHTASRSNLEVDKVRNLFAIQYFGPGCVRDFNAEEMYGRWKHIISDRNGSSTSARRRNLGTLLRKVLNEARIKRDETSNV